MLGRRSKLIFKTQKAPQCIVVIWIARFYGFSVYAGQQAPYREVYPDGRSHIAGIRSPHPHRV